ncbi:hypothetical protein SDC9_177316 [bioreactor metagenome]|uniref:Uncharacterized protein n=1 Tax=bioreactor metagenome TaxID=1076179 RepID=A0A645H1Z2_9ZZZZ
MVFGYFKQGRAKTAAIVQTVQAGHQVMDGCCSTERILVPHGVLIGIDAYLEMAFQICMDLYRQLRIQILEHAFGFHQAIEGDSQRVVPMAEQCIVIVHSQVGVTTLQMPEIQSIRGGKGLGELDGKTLRPDDEGSCNCKPICTVKPQKGMRQG